MADINCFTFTCRLTKDAELKTLSTGKKLLVMNGAINTGYGEYKKTLWIKVQLWGDRGEKILPYTVKGSLIGVTGELSRNEWVNSNTGTTCVDFVVDARDIQLLASKKQNADSDESSSNEDTSDDITF